MITNPFIKNKPKGVYFVRVVDVKLHSNFQSLFPINKKVRDSIAESIRKDGFNKDYPLVIWKEKGYLIDGHTRLAASKVIGIKKLPVIYKSFDSTKDATDFALSLQFNRRNLKDADLFSFVLTMDIEHLPGPGRKQERLAKVCNISVTKAMRLLKVKNESSDLQKKQILDANLSINSVYNKLNKRRAHLNSRKKSTSNSITINCDSIQSKLKDWLSSNTVSGTNNSVNLIKVQAVLEVLPSSSFKSSVIKQMAEVEDKYSRRQVYGRQEAGE